MAQVITSAKLLVVARDSTILQSLWSAARSNHWQLDITASAWDALDKLHSGSVVDLLLVDVFNGEIQDFHILRYLRKLRPEVRMILIDRADDANKRHESLRLGSCDYFVTSAAGFRLETAIRCRLSSACGAAHTGTRNLSNGAADGALKSAASISDVPQAETTKRQYPTDAGEYKSLRSLLRSVKEDTERNAIALALQKTGWNRKAAARLLKISYRSILYKIDQYQMTSFGQPPMGAARRLESDSGIHLQVHE